MKDLNEVKKLMEQVMKKKLNDVETTAFILKFFN